MSKGVKIALGIVLLLISIQFLFAGFQNLLPAIKFNNSVEIALTSGIILLGALFFVLAFLVFSNKKWVKTPITILLVMLLAYAVYTLIQSFSLIPDKILSQSLINWQIYLMLGYSILAILGIFLNWKNKLA